MKVSARPGYWTRRSSVMDSSVQAEFETSVSESQQNSGAGGVDDTVINCLIMMHSSVISATLCSGRPSSSDEG